MLNRAQLYGSWRRTVPNPEPVTFRSRKAGAQQASFDSYSLPSAKRKPLTKDDIELVGFEASRVMLWWQVWEEWCDNATAINPANLPCPPPKVGDVIEDSDGVGYVVTRVEVKLFGLVHNCLCQKKV